jgi:PQQ-dependent catabolism-associated CXXCW motif protein
MDGVRAMACGLLLAVAGSAAGAQEQLQGTDPQTGFRMERYRAPVPETVPGGRTVETEEVAALAEEGGTVLIDTFPGKGAGPDPENGAWRMAEPHETIPGAVWLPGIGFGALDMQQEDYFRRNLERLTGGDESAAVLFFCKADCWHSWNAARRAAQWGYDNVMWYPTGSDGWREGGFGMEPAEPVNFMEGSQ